MKAKRKVDVEWIKCSNPACGKWRAVSRGLGTKVLLERMNRNKFNGGTSSSSMNNNSCGGGGGGGTGVALGEWFCSMNNWDETTATCAAPQEPLWNCRWNLSNQ